MGIIQESVKGLCLDLLYFFSQLQKLHVIHVLYNDNDLLSYILHSVVHRYDFNIFITSSSSFDGFITNQFNDLLSVGVLA